MGRFAPQITRIDMADGTTQQVANGADVVIYGFIASQRTTSSNRSFTVEEADGTEFMNIELDAKGLYNFNIPFIAHKGFQINPAGSFSSMEVTVFHSSPGGVVYHGEVAPKYTQGKMTETFTLEGGSPVKVFGMSFGNSSTSANIDFTMLDGDGTNTLAVFEIDGGENIILSNHFIADKGLQFTTSSDNDDLDIVVFHSNPGI